MITISFSGTSRATEVPAMSGRYIKYPPGFDLSKLTGKERANALSAMRARRRRAKNHQKPR